MNSLRISQEYDGWSLWRKGGTVLRFDFDRSLGRWLVVRPEITDEKFDILSNEYYALKPWERHQVQSKILDMLELRCKCGWQINLNELVTSSERRSVRMYGDIAGQTVTKECCPHCGEIILIGSAIDAEDRARWSTRAERRERLLEEHDGNPGFGRDHE